MLDPKRSGRTYFISITMSSLYFIVAAMVSLVILVLFLISGKCATPSVIFVSVFCVVVSCLCSTREGLVEFCFIKRVGIEVELLVVVVDVDVDVDVDKDALERSSIDSVFSSWILVFVSDFESTVLIVAASVSAARK